MTGYLKRYGPPLFTLAVFACVAYALHHELAKYDWHEVKKSLAALADWRVALALALAFGSYLAATANDYLGVRYAGRRLPLRTTTLVGFISYAISYNVGFTALGGTAMRYQLYTVRGLSTAEIAKIVVFECTSFFVGVFFLGGILLLGGVPALGQALHLPPAVDRIVGLSMLGALAFYFAVSLRGGGRIAVRGWQLAVPTPPLAIGQMLGSLVDIGMAAAAMYVLLPDIGLSYWQFLPLFLAAMLSGLASTVPGGLGVLEAVMLVFLRGHGEQAAILGALLGYRVIYYLVPLTLAVGMLLVTTLRRRRREMLGALAKTFDKVPALTTRILGSAVYLAGVFLLLSGLLPPAPGHAEWLAGFFPATLGEIAYPVCSVLGVAMLFYARGIQRRLKKAFHVTLSLAAAGVVMALLRGMDYAASLVMAITLLSLLGGHSEFDRDKPLFSQAFGGQWFATTLIVLALTLLVGTVVYRSYPADYAALWQAEWPGHAGRVLRTAVCAVLAALSFGVIKAGRGRAFILAERGRVTKGEAMEVAGKFGATLPGDADYLLAATKNAVMAYRRKKGLWVSYGAPVGDEAAASELIWTFTDLAEISAATPIFRDVPPDEQLPFLRAGYMPVTNGDADGGAVAENVLTRSIVYEIRSILRRENAKVRKSETQRDDGPEIE